MSMIKPYGTETSFALKYGDTLAHGSNVRKKKGISSSCGVKQRQNDKKANPKNNECSTHWPDQMDVENAKQLYSQQVSIS